MISIVIPVYNAENYIEDCVNSICRQSFADWELLLINNGSADRSLEICQHLAKTDARIRLFHQEENMGVSRARNQGMREAKGEWITFVDADDLIKPDFLEVLWETGQEAKADMVVCGYEKLYSRERQKSEKPDSPESKMNSEDSAAGQAPGNRRLPEYQIYRIEDYLKNYLLEGNTHCWGVLYRKKLLAGIGFPADLSIGEDLLFLIDAALAAGRIAVTDYAGYRYFINTQGAMEKPFTPSYMDQISCWQQAGEKLAGLYPDLRVKLESILLVSVMLVVGKLALLGEERKNYEKELSLCLAMADEYGKKKEVVKLLPGGYSLKVTLFRTVPGIYLRLYGRMKKG